MHIFIEAETFDDLGGWTVETQCREAMGSFWIFAHGIGRPVADAATDIHLPHNGKWHFFVRTRDWSAVWQNGTPAGRFQLLIDKKAFAAELGTNGPEWAWQMAGSGEFAAGTHRIALHDLTGFDGRCDAVFITDDPQDLPPDDPETLKIFRRKACNTVIEDDPQFYDLIVCGGGYAGLCTALAAAKENLKTIVLQDRPVAGGCGSSEVRVWTGGNTGLEPYPALGKFAQMISPVCGSPGMKKDKELFEDDRKAALFKKQKNLLLYECVIGVETSPHDPQKISAVITRSVRTGRETRRKGRFFTDATGDAFIARCCGCEVMYGSEGREQFHEFLAPEQPQRTVMGHSVLWETRRKEHKVDFPDIDWGIKFDENNALERFDCCWDWEAGQFRDQVMDIEYIRDYGLMACYANWSFLKNHSHRKKEWENMELEWVSAIGGKRESYRVKGDLILTQNDLMNAVKYPDATGCTTWSIDLHFPDPENCRKFGEPFQSCAYHLVIPEPYPIPYRCMYARDMKNLFLAGRCMSLTHIAFSSVRVMRTLGMLGEVAGMAAAIGVRHDCSCREVYLKYLEELKSLMRGNPQQQPPRIKHDAFHFMRPVGTMDNVSEDCWIDYDYDGRMIQSIPPELQKCIDDLQLNRKAYSEIENPEQSRKK
ncbi:MAG: FAD-dependent oxidoreductase [Lentisphaeria bacterium]|nr:FAD-dependent oxidoreductase [Lentisphaeria bacterium]